MRRREMWRGVVYTLLAVAIGGGAMLLVGGAAAPTTQGLILQTASHLGTAAAGNGDPAYLLVSAYNEAGSIRGIASGSFSVSVLAAPNGATPITKTAVTEPVSGVYKISLAPELSQYRWVSGKYVMSITFTSPNGSGVTLSELVIP
ncbi:hypothetical protein KJ567_02300 [Candidatus Bipolaricaulota bacterium]|nr:hypothetical protein [Candidatus Bipolaricaulota bacterium]